ncbi:Oidioi.mRNA.OKI2018_I69.PAR.g12290.t1.cds [Oikopleura dioica]|uniref:Oidioi.mRNA.OKI2018_I69.PAR.g12290.t1.cds n=1 Tax=Oikopleura dioica TaxID=34765 RepID=A0ABN7S3Z6_OIKDI|nr:Oidioi.mRNA.OKI2018_I69.PAR.g12290.t1.cds [Oikopleura dioica]
MDDLLKLPYWRCKPYVRPKPSETTEQNSRKRNSGMIEENLKRKKHKEQKKAKFQEKMAKEGVKPKYEMCVKCPGNPRGLKCGFLFCKACCRKRLEYDDTDCPGHRIYGKASREAHLKERKLREAVQVESAA